MKINLIIAIYFLILIFPIYVCAQETSASNNDGLLVEGIVKSLQPVEDKSAKTINIILQIQLTNTGANPIFFWNQRERRDGFRFSDLITTRRLLSRSKSFVRGEILEDIPGGVSLSLDPEWQKVRKELNQKSPPNKLTITLSPKQKIIYDITHTIRCKETSNYSCDVLTANKPIWLKLCYEAWSSELEKNPRNKNKLKFGQSLQNKWKKEGRLRLNDFCTEPIQIDLTNLHFQ